MDILLMRVMYDAPIDTSMFHLGALYDYTDIPLFVLLHFLLCPRAFTYSHGPTPI
jgi:hypothetical protein